MWSNILKFRYGDILILVIRLDVHCGRNIRSVLYWWKDLCSIEGSLNSVPFWFSGVSKKIKNGATISFWLDIEVGIGQATRLWLGLFKVWSSLTYLLKRLGLDFLKSLFS